MLVSQKFQENTQKNCLLVFVRINENKRKAL